jgi:pilus assembly protein CpaB
MRTRNNMTIVVGVVLALLGAGVAVAAGRNTDDGGSAGATRQVVVATRDIAAGTPVAANLVAVRAVSRAAVPANAVTSVAQLTGQVALFPIAANLVVTPQMFGVQGVAAAGGVALPKGKRAIGVELGFAPGALRYIVPGDRIDVLASRKAGDASKTTVLLTGVQVVATTPGTGNGAPTAATAGAGNLDFLLAVDQDQAIVLANAVAKELSLYFTIAARKGAA